MKLRIGDLVIVDSLPCVVTKIVNSKVFEGGEDCCIITILHNNNRRDVMSWRATKVNC